MPTKERADVDPEGELLMGEALIMANLHLDPKSLTPEEYAIRYAQAIWLERYRLQNQAEMLAQLFGSGGG